MLESNKQRSARKKREAQSTIIVNTATLNSPILTNTPIKSSIYADTTLTWVVVLCFVLVFVLV